MNFSKRYFFCNKHLIQYISYCSYCNINLCSICEIKHYNHKDKVIVYKKEILDEKKKKEIENEIKINISKINEYKNEITQINNSFNNLIENIEDELDNYKKLYNKMIIILNNLTNYQNIKNILYFKNLNLIKDINIFLKENIINKLKYLTNQFYLSKTKLIYKIEQNNKQIRLFIILLIILLNFIYQFSFR